MDGIEEKNGVTKTGEGEGNTNKTNTSTNNSGEAGTEKQGADEEKIKSDAIASFLKELGVEDSDSLKGIVTKAKEDEDANKTDLQKKDDALKETTKQLGEERKARYMAEAKLTALTLGAKTNMVDDLVAVAMTKVTKDKDIGKVIAEIKDSDNGSAYFETEEAEDEDKKPTKKTVTRKRVTTKSGEENKKNKDGDNKPEYEGTMAQRLFQNRKKQESHWFK